MGAEFSFCQGVNIPASLQIGGFAAQGLSVPYTSTPYPPLEHYAGFDDSTVSAERKPRRATGRRPIPKKRALEEEPTSEQGTCLKTHPCTAVAECIASVNPCKTTLYASTPHGVCQESRA